MENRCTEYRFELESQWLAMGRPPIQSVDRAASNAPRDACLRVGFKPFDVCVGYKTQLAGKECQVFLFEAQICPEPVGIPAVIVKCHETAEHTLLRATGWQNTSFEAFP